LLACCCCCCQIELSPVSDLQGLEAQVQAHFRSTNVVYAMLIEGEPQHAQKPRNCSTQQAQRHSSAGTPSLS
jgi:hypothetical protein